MRKTGSRQELYSSNNKNITKKLRLLALSGFGITLLVSTRMCGLFLFCTSLILFFMKQRK